MSERIPAISSFVLILIGCETDTATSGIDFSTSSTKACINFSRSNLQSSLGFNCKYISVRSIPIGSVAISGEPVLDTACNSSGKFFFKACSILLPVSIDSERETEGSRATSKRSEPSSNSGINSAPKFANITKLSTIDTIATVNTLFFAFINLSSSGI